MIPDGSVSGSVTLDTNGDSLTVESGGTITNGFGAGVYVNGGGGMIGVDIVNSGLIDGAGNYGIWSFNGGNINSLNNTVDGRIQGAFQGIYVQDGSLSNLTNAGRITGTANNGIFIDTGNLINLTNLSTGVISGADRGIDVRGNLTGLNNAGIVAGGGSYGISVLNGDLLDLTNEQSGVIAGSNVGLGGDFFAGGEVRNIVNAGRIAGNSFAGIFIEHNDVFGLANLSTGVITGGLTGVSVLDGSLTGFINDGQILADGDSALTAHGVQAGASLELTNSGSIVATNIGAGTSQAVTADAITRIVNSGRIFSDQGGTNYAIREIGAGADTDLILFPGSVIRGRIDIEGGGAGTNRLFVHNGLSARLAFETAVPDVIETYGALTTTNGLAVGVADTSAVAAQDNAISDLMRSVSGVVDQHFNTDANSRFGIWTKGFGAHSMSAPTGSTVSVNHSFGGVLAGADGELGDSFRLGVFAGLSGGVLNVAVPYGQEIRTRNHFAGVYGRLDLERFHLGFGLTGGISGYDSARPIADNRLGQTALDTAIQSYNGYFISPEVSIGAGTMRVGEVTFSPSATVRYSRVRADGFDEISTGSGDGDITVSERTTDVIDARMQITIPIETGIAGTQLGLTTGIDGRVVVAGGTFDATLLGTTVPDFDPGGARLAVGAFAGVDFTRTFSDTAAIVASAEVGTGTETAFRAKADVAIRIGF